MGERLGVSMLPSARLADKFFDAGSSFVDSASGA